MTDQSYQELRSKIPLLLQHSNLSFLIGAGCSHCAGLPLMSGLTGQVCENLSPDKVDPDHPQAKELRSSRNLLADICSRYPKGTSSNIEDYLSEIQDVVAILTRHQAHGVADPTHTAVSGTHYGLSAARGILREIKTQIVSILSEGVTTVEHHRKFIRAIHGRLRAGRERASTPINYFILNYDTNFEDALALEGILFSDGFVGGTTAWWDPSTYDAHPYGARHLQATVVKLHGSIDWVPSPKGSFPLRIRESLRAQGTSDASDPAVIFPANVKYREAQNDPYALMMQRFRRSMAETQDHVVCVLGYSFGDEHINSEIEHALAENDGLSLIAFVGTDTAPPSVQRWLDEPSYGRKIQVYGRRAVWKGAEVVLELSDDEKEYPWYRFETLASLLSGRED